MYFYQLVMDIYYLLFCSQDDLAFKVNTMW